MGKCCIEKRCGEVLQGRVVKKCFFFTPLFDTE